MLNKKQLIEVFEDTKKIAFSLESSIYTNSFSYNDLPGKAFGVGEKNVSVVETDTITTAINLHGQGRTCILNMASPKRAGGGVINGAKAQEECLFRCTNLFESVFQTFYPLGVDESLYTTEALIIKDKDYNVIPEPIEVDCITVAALNLNKQSFSDEEYNEITKKKIDMMLNLASAYRCDNLVLGAWGCGVFDNEPVDIAKLFLEVIKNSGYNFKNIVFGVINDHNSVDDNYRIFKEILG